MTPVGMDSGVYMSWYSVIYGPLAMKSGVRLGELSKLCFVLL